VKGDVGGDDGMVHVHALYFGPAISEFELTAAWATAHGERCRVSVQRVERGSARPSKAAMEIGKGALYEVASRYFDGKEVSALQLSKDVEVAAAVVLGRSELYDPEASLEPYVKGKRLNLPRRYGSFVPMEGRTDHLAVRSRVPCGPCEQCDCDEWTVGTMQPLDLCGSPLDYTFAARCAIDFAVWRVKDALSRTRDGPPGEGALAAVLASVYVDIDEWIALGGASGGSSLTDAQRKLVRDSVYENDWQYLVQREQVRFARSSVS